jgi:rRNA maturation RNase YbeY
MVLNRQAGYAADLPALRGYVRRLKRELRLGGQDFNLCLVSDREIERLNAAYRGKHRPTDVLSFPWKGETRQGGNGLCGAELRDFLGDIVISMETARRNARLERHSVGNEIRWLVLHGVLHLLGYDHERDHGEMTGLELALREQLGIAGSRATRRLKRPAKGRHG